MKSQILSTSKKTNESEYFPAKYFNYNHLSLPKILDGKLVIHSSFLTARDSPRSLTQEQVELTIFKSGAIDCFYLKKSSVGRADITSQNQSELDKSVVSGNICKTR